MTSPSTKHNPALRRARRCLGSPRLGAARRSTSRWAIHTPTFRRTNPPSRRPSGGWAHLPTRSSEFSPPPWTLQRARRCGRRSRRPYLPGKAAAARPISGGQTPCRWRRTPGQQLRRPMVPPLRTGGLGSGGGGTAMPLPEAPPPSAGGRGGSAAPGGPAPRGGALPAAAASHGVSFMDLHNRAANGGGGVGGLPGLSRTSFSTTGSAAVLESTSPSRSAQGNAYSGCRRGSTMILG
mmetsp:Transcript_48102/g.153992  ORF Transcript_48102/g.153992 Transcript_48102/m.153992 type:complete len:237 (+) Transcript_48102:146-856(+)